MWHALGEEEGADDYANVEGGSVEQHRDQRLRLHHCANYAALLTLLDGHGDDLLLLELGCGSGALSAAFARSMPPNWRLLATDYSEALVARARSVHGHPRLSFERLDARALEPGRLAGVDVVLMLEVIEHMTPEDAVAVLHRFHRGLEPGARLVMTTLDRSPFARAHSGYAPHAVEYSHRSMTEFLSARDNNPFDSFRVHRLASSRIAEEHVRAERFGGYFVNRLQRLVLGLAARSAALERARASVMQLLYRGYSRLPKRDGFDLDGYVESIGCVRHGDACPDEESFGLVVELVKR